MTNLIVNVSCLESTYLNKYQYNCANLVFPDCSCRGRDRDEKYSNVQVENKLKIEYTYDLLS